MFTALELEFIAVPFHQSRIVPFTPPSLRLRFISADVALLFVKVPITQVATCFTPAPPAGLVTDTVPEPPPAAFSSVQVEGAVGNAGAASASCGAGCDLARAVGAEPSL